MGNGQVANLGLAPVASPPEAGNRLRLHRPLPRRAASAWVTAESQSLASLCCPQSRFATEISTLISRTHHQGRASLPASEPCCQDVAKSVKRGCPILANLV